jgi:hypothetical protein
MKKHNQIESKTAYQAAFQIALENRNAALEASSAAYNHLCECDLVLIAVNKKLGNNVVHLKPEFDSDIQKTVNTWPEAQCVKYNIPKSNLEGKRDPHRFSVLYQQVCNMAGGVRFEIPEAMIRAYENSVGEDFLTNLWTHLESEVDSFKIEADCYDYEDGEYEYDLT